MASYMGISNAICILDNIGIYRGDFLQLDVDVVNENDVPITLDTITVKFKICDAQEEDIVYLEKEGEMVVANENVVRVTLLTADTENLSISKYRYIIELNYETGNKNIGKGYITIL